MHNLDLFDTKLTISGEEIVFLFNTLLVTVTIVTFIYALNKAMTAVLMYLGTIPVSSL